MNACLARVTSSRLTTPRPLLPSNLTAPRGFRTTAATAHCRLIKTGSATDTYSWNNILTAYSRRGRVEDARKVFDEIPKRDIVSWNSLIACYVSHGKRELAWQLLKTMVGQGMESDQYTFGSILKSVANAGQFDLGCQLHATMVKRRIDHNVFAGSALVDMYAKCHAVDDAYLLFVVMPERNTVTWNAVIAGYAQLGELSAAFELLDQMERQGLVPDEATFASILTLVEKPAHYRLMSQMHAKIIKYGRGIDIAVYNAAVTAYSQCDSISDSRKVFEDMDDIKDLVSWNSMLAAYAGHGVTDQAIKLFAQMQEFRIEQDVYTFTSVISACFACGESQQGRALHGLVIKNGLENEISVCNALIAMYIGTNDNCMIEEAMKCFNLMTIRDTVSWNSILTGLSQNGLSEEALKFYSHMRSSQLTVDHYAFSAVIRACSEIAVLRLGQQVHSSIIKTGFDSNDFVASSLIYMYSKCGVIEYAYRIFDSSRKESSVLWNSIIFGYAQNGQGQIALRIFSEMQAFGAEPDHITFVGILSACSHIGLVDEGLAFLKSMESHHGISLRMEHYACAIDLYGRAGRLEEAKMLIESMPLEPDASVWMPLLGACRIHGNIELAIHAAKHLLVLEPREHSTYVLLSHMYADFGMWDGRAIIQRAMRDRGINKVPGWSWIEVDNKAHAFNAEDRSHLQAQEIYAMLLMLMEDIESIGRIYISDAEMHHLVVGQ